MRTYKVERNEYGLYTIERSGHGSTQAVCSTENHAEATNVCSALNAMEYNTRLAEAFEAMLDLLKEVLRYSPASAPSVKWREAARAALALADKVSGDNSAMRRGYCSTCGILGAPKFYHDISKCYELGHNVSGDAAATKGE